MTLILEPRTLLRMYLDPFGKTGWSRGPTCQTGLGEEEEIGAQIPERLNKFHQKFTELPLFAGQVLLRLYRL